MTRGCIYLIHNTISGKVYVGQTTKIPQKRFWDHISSFNCGKGNSHLRRSWKKYGREAFQFSVLEEVQKCTKATLTIYENAWIQFFKLSGVNLYNQRDAADSNKGIKFSAEARKHNSEAKKRAGTKPPPRTGVAPWNKGKHSMTETAKQAMQQGRVGKRSVNSRVIDSEVLEIRSLKGLIPCKELAARFNVTMSCISQITLFKTYKHLKEAI
jgi:group I intron endonuclease